MLYKEGLAYQAEALVNYDPVDKTVLANEQVHIPTGVLCWPILIVCLGRCQWLLVAVRSEGRKVEPKAVVLPYNRLQGSSFE